MSDSYLYLLINALIIAYPLAQSYERRLRFLNNWKHILAATAIAGSVFLAWDELFTALGVWGFNERYLTGVYIGRLPVEECLFFITTPFACLFIYEVVGYFLPDHLIRNPAALLWFFFVLCVLLSWAFFPRLYTTVCFLFTATILLVRLIKRGAPWLGRFFVTYFIALIPFLLVNGWLTGMFTDEPVVWYGSNEIIGLRLGSIPIEDAIYLLGYLLLVVWLYERSRGRIRP